MTFSSGCQTITPSPSTRKGMRSSSSLAPERIREIGSTLRRNTIAPSTVFESLAYTGREEIAGFAPVPGHDWVVGVSESRDYFAAPLDRLFEKVILSVLLAGVIFVALALIFARSIVRPIEKLTAAAHSLKSGDYEKANIEVRSNDEVGQLARTFNVMIDVLRQRERERERGNRRNTDDVIRR